MTARWMVVAALAACSSDPDPNAEVEAHYNELAASVQGACGTFETSVPVEVCTPPASDVSAIVTCLQSSLTTGGEGFASATVTYYSEDLETVAYTGEAYLFVANGKVTEFSHADGSWYERHCMGVGIAFPESQCPRATGVDCDE